MPATESDGHVHADLKEWAGAAPNALVSGRVDSSVGAMAANVLTASAIAALPDIPVHPGTAKYLKEKGQWKSSWKIGMVK